MLLLLLLPLHTFAQCPDPVVTHDTACASGTVILVADGPPGLYTWYYDDSGSWVPTGTVDPVFTTTISSDTIFAVLYEDSAYTCQSNPVFDTIIFLDLVYSVPGDTSEFGDGVWNAYCFNDIVWQDYVGYYVDTNDAINSLTQWNEFQSPKTNSSKVPSYQGCNVNIEQHSIRYKKKNFPPGIYRIDIEDHDDDCFLYVNGSLVYSHAGYGHGHFDVWTGFLDNTSTIEFKWMDYQVNSRGGLSITPVSPVIVPGTVQGDQTFCLTGDPQPLSVGKVIITNNDSYVRDGTFANDIHGLSDPNSMDTRTHTVNNNAEIYISFDISSLSTPVNSAILQMAGFNIVGLDPNIHVFVYPVTDTTWTENSLTWNNKPVASAPAIASTEMYDNDATWYYWDITSYVQTEKALGNNEITLMVRDTNTVDLVLKFLSKEAGGLGEGASRLLINHPIKGCNLASYQWQYQTNCSGGWVDIPGADTLTYDPPAGLTQTTCYRLAVSDICGNVDYTNEVTVTINNPAPPAMSDTIRCGMGTLSISASGSASDYKWYDASMGGNLLNTGAVFTTPVLSNTTSYYVASLANSCEGDRAKVDATILPAAVAGSLSASVSQVCEDINSGTVTLSGNTGIVSGWLMSLDNFNSSLIDLYSTNSQETFTNLTATTSYKTIVQNGTCLDTTDSETIMVDPLAAAGTISLTDINENGGTLTLSGYTGSIARWEESSDGFNSFDTVAINLSVLNFDKIPMYYRAVVQSGVCPLVVSDSIFVDDLTIYNSITPNDDGINDVWIIDGIERYSKNTIHIFNRWGDLVYKEKGYNNQDRVWKGKSNTGMILGGTLPDGTYFYQVEIGYGKPITGYVIISK